MSQYIIFGTLIIVSVIIITLIRLKNQKLQPDRDNTRRASGMTFPEREVPNDKLVIIEDISEADIRKVVQEFCNTYNKKSYQAIPRLIRLSDKRFAITFPYNIRWEIFCFFINYLHYPVELDRAFPVVGWATAQSTDNWITADSANKQVMLYISDSDTEYDNVYLTTSDNIGYKLGFANGPEKQLLNIPEKAYMPPPVTVGVLATRSYTDFK